jgi:hypothetical protein
VTPDQVEVLAAGERALRGVVAQRKCRHFRPHFCPTFATTIPLSGLEPACEMRVARSQGAKPLTGDKTDASSSSRDRQRCRRRRIVSIGPGRSRLCSN